MACSTNYQAPVQEVARQSTSSSTNNSTSNSSRTSEPISYAIDTPIVRRTRTMVGSHQVSSGETLIGIAFGYELEYTALARVNGIDSPYVIYPGQILQLDTSKMPVIPAPIPTQTLKDSKGPGSSITNSETTTKVPSNKSMDTGSVNKIMRWAWPSSGKVIANYSSEGVENKGIDLEGEEGDAVLAAEAGEVIYAGSGLLRYGDLLIIRHNAKFLSAYAHNSKLLVKEGDSVSRGQTIAALGSTGIDREMLHFEIRENGEAVDPLRFLPSR